MREAIWQRALLGRDAASAAGDEAGEAPEHAGVAALGVSLPELLVVLMARDQQVQAQVRVQAIEPGSLEAAGKVRHYDLPVGLGAPQLVLGPPLLLLPEGVKPGLARLDRGGASRFAAVSVLRVVLGPADVVLRVLLRVKRVHEVGVKHEVVHREGGVHDLQAVVRRGHHPPRAGPGVRNLLVPAVDELAAAPVMVAQDAEPGLAVEPGTVVDALVNGVELMPGGRVDEIHGATAILLDPTPVEVVADIEDVLGVLESGSRPKLLGHQQLRLAVAQAKQKFMRTASDRGGALSCRASLSGASAGVLPAVGEEEVVARERPSGDEEDGDDSPLVRCNAYVGGSRPLTAPAAMVTDDDDADNQEQDAEGSDGELPRTLSGGCRSRLSKDLTVKLAAAPETGAQRLEATLRPMAWPGVCLSARFAGLDVPMLLGLIEGLRLGPEAAAKGRAELRRALGTVLASPSLLNASFCFPGLRRPRVDAAGLQRTLEELWATGQVDQQLEAQLRDAAAQGLRRWGGDPGAWADAPPPLRHRDQLRGLPTLLLFPLVAEAETSPHACALMEQLANLIASLPGEGRRVLVDIVMEDMVPVLRSVLVRNVRRFCNAAIRKAAQSRFMGSAVWNGLLVLDLLAFANQAYQRQLRSQLPAHLSAPDPSFTRTLSRGLSKTASEGVPGAGAGGAAARPESAAAAGASFGLAAAALGPPVPPSDFQLEALAEDVVPPDVEFALFMQNAQSKIPSAAEVLTLRPHDERLHSFMVHRDLLPPAFVRRVLQRENLFRQQLQQQRNLQELLQAAMMGQVQPGPGGMLSIDPSQMFFMLQVRREHLLEDTMEALQNAAPADLQRQIKVSFRGEEGQDAGGVSREFFRLLGEQLFSLKSGLFDQKVAEEARVLWFDQSSPRDVADFWLVGVIVGLAVYNNLPGLDVRFPVCAFKKLRGEALGLEDLAEVQPPVAGSLGALLAWEPPEGTSAAEAAVIFESTFCLDFSVTYEERGAPRAVDLRPGGSETPVTPANRQEFVRLYCEWVLERSVERQFASFKKGFSRICESPLFQALRGSELAQIVMGEAELDLQDLRPKARLEGFSPDSDFIKGFWEILGTFDEGQRRGFLAFVTGSNRAPVGGLKELALLVQRNGGESDRLPLAHTCFNTLLLPEYSSQRRLREALLTAIENAEGFGLE
mmetsp:Transcript_1617/g.4833  ORF Transcript_1617/g.4833 Transcript_1617/m.4833 type:complete len:1176 (-) Transcript_1617:46-3573(-)